MKLGLIKIVIYNDMLIDRALRRDRGRKLPISGILDTGNSSW